MAWGIFCHVSECRALVDNGDAWRWWDLFWYTCLRSRVTWASREPVVVRTSKSEARAVSRHFLASGSPPELSPPMSTTLWRQQPVLVTATMIAPSEDATFSYLAGDPNIPTRHHGKVVAPQFHGTCRPISLLSSPILRRFALWRSAGGESCGGQRAVEVRELWKSESCGSQRAVDVTSHSSRIQ